MDDVQVELKDHDYLVRDIPMDVFAAATKRGMLESPRRNMKTIIIDLLRYYAKYGMPSKEGRKR